MPAIAVTMPQDSESETVTQADASSVVIQDITTASLKSLPAAMYKRDVREFMLLRK
jgi:hypothetical protein